MRGLIELRFVYSAVIAKNLLTYSESFKESSTLLILKVGQFIEGVISIQQTSF